MLSAKRQRIQAPKVAQAQCSPVSQDVKRLVELTKGLPSIVLSDVVALLLEDESTAFQAQAALASCQKKHGYDLLKLVRSMVEECVPESDEFCKMGRLADKDGDLSVLLSQARHWMTMHWYEEAFQLVWACVEKASDVEERGGDSCSWEHWDDDADSLLLQAAQQYHDDWASLDLVPFVKDMQSMQKSADDFGYTFFTQSLPKLKLLIESRKDQGRDVAL